MRKVLSGYRYQRINSQSYFQLATVSETFDDNRRESSC